MIHFELNYFLLNINYLHWSVSHKIQQSDNIILIKTTTPMMCLVRVTLVLLFLKLQSDELEVRLRLEEKKSPRFIIPCQS